MAKVDTSLNAQIEQAYRALVAATQNYTSWWDDPKVRGTLTLEAFKNLVSRYGGGQAGLNSAIGMFRRVVGLPAEGAVYGAVDRPPRQDMQEPPVGDPYAGPSQPSEDVGATPVGTPGVSTPGEGMMMGVNPAAMGTVAGGALPEDAYRFEDYPYAGFLRRMGQAGLGGYSPAEQYAQYNWQNPYSNYLMRSLTASARGEEPGAWMGAPMEWTPPERGQWGEFLSSMGQAPAQLQEYLAANPETVYSLASNVARSRYATPVASWMSRQYAPTLQKYQATGEPGSTFRDFLTKYLGL